MIELESGSGFGISVVPYGASWASCRVPMGDGTLREVLLGGDSEDDYRRQHAYLGASIGRFANRIRGGQMTIDGRPCALDRNDGEHCLHGGFSGFARRDWAIEELAASRVRLAIVSADGEGGFPGQMSAQIHYSLDVEQSSVSIEYLAAVDRPCPVSLTSHAYFNLDGDGADSRRHRLRLRSGRFLPIDADGVPLGAIRDVRGTPFDFRCAARLDSAPQSHPQLRLNKGYNHAFILDADCRQMAQPAAELISADGSLALRMFTTLPAVHLYGGNYLAGTPARNGLRYADYAGIALEAEFPPDAPNHPEWPVATSILQPGAIYRQSIRFQFTVL